MADATTHQFQAEVTRVLGLVINSLYSNKEIFLRELVSNAADALDKLRFRGITEPAFLEGEPLHIRIAPDEDAGTLTISDNGIGMSRQDLERQLGTIAHSGSQDFLSRLEEAQRSDVSLIGQFGVGFYSGFLVADSVRVVSRAAGTDEVWAWCSDGQESFTIEEAERAERGTDIVLHLKEEAKDYLQSFTLKELIKRYSDYIDHPIELSDDDGFSRVNEASALWQRPPADISDEQYEEFFKHLTHDWEPPLARRHFRIEGTQMFTGLMFVPKRPPHDLFSPDASHGVRLHVKRVFIMDDCEELLPKWLRFVRGVVDSEDLPLNVSRELLQDSGAVRIIRKQVVKQSLDMCREVLEGDDAASFWSSYGAVLKEGLHFDLEHRDALSKLVRWPSTSREELVTLSDYVSGMKDDQKAIYYALGATRKMVENAPHLEVLKKRGYEVLLMTDAIDQFAVSALGEFEGQPLVSAMDADLKLESEESDDADRESFAALLSRFRAVLQDHVGEVRISDRLTDSPACLVLPEGGLPPYIERLLRLQNTDATPQKRVFELNPDHPIVHSLRALHEADEASEEVAEWIELLYDQALLAEGSPVEDPARLVSRLTELLTETAKRRASEA